MTPQRLVLDEFGPYTEPETIDFDRLGEQHLFLIHGPTGSGKSTLLDAICFALYGETSGDERDGQEMRSDFAGLGEPTTVTLDFRLGAKRYRVARRPKQTLAKQRGEGTTDKPADAELYDRTETEARDWDDEGRPLASGVRDVTDAVESLLGLACEQFRQVVMLPQGQFRRFLSATSDEREDILKVLFETHRFERLQEILKEMAKETRTRVDTLRQKQAAILEHHDAESMDALREQTSATEDALDAAREQLQAAESDLEAAREALSAAKEARTVLDERDAAREAVADLRKQRDAHAARKEQQANAQRAAEVAPVYDDLSTRRADQEKADAALHEATATMSAAASALETANDRLASERDRDDERESLREEKTRLDDWVDVMADVQEATDALEEKRAALSDATAEVEAAEAQIQQLEADKAAAQEQYAAMQETAQQLPVRQQTFAQAETLKQRAETLAEKRSARRDAREAVARADAAVSEHETALNDATAHLASLRTQRRDAYAAVLADKLTDGDPCPVCGATEHPQPAQADHEVPGEAAIADAQQRVEEARAALNEARSCHADARAVAERRAAEVDSLLEAHPKLESLSAEALQDRYDEAKAALEEARHADTNAQSLQEDIRSIETAHAEQVNDLNSLREARDEAQDAVSRLESKAETLRDQLPDGIESLDALTKKRHAVADQLDVLEAARKEAVDAHQEAREAKVQAQEALANAEANAEAAAEALRTAKDRFGSALREHGFADADAFLAARMDRADREALRDTVDAFDRDWNAALDRQSRAEEDAADIAPPDVDAAVERVEALEETVEEAREAVFTRRRDLGDLTDSLKGLVDLRDDLQDADARYAAVGLLHETARGDNPLKMSLQRFVLATRLEDVLRKANHHMAQMTQQRYSLHRKAGVDDFRRGAGLDLEVADTYTGDTRPVATLSGGEGFQAALALALGLSDVVQGLSGGRHLETIFIDEGFGSLDPEALDRALDTLMRLREGGRLVGIISHVADLKQRISARIEVQPSQEGSTLNVVA